MSTSQLIDQTMRQWDDYATIEEEELFECVTASVERQHIGSRKHPLWDGAYSISSVWRDAESRHA